MLEPKEIKTKLQGFVGERLNSQLDSIHKLEAEGEKLAKNMFEGVKGMIPEEHFQRLAVLPAQSIQRYWEIKEKINGGVSAFRTRLDIPSKSEIEKLNAKIDELSAEVAKLKKRPSAQKRTATQKRTTKKKA